MFTSFFYESYCNLRLVGRCSDYISTYLSVCVLFGFTSAKTYKLETDTHILYLGKEDKKQ
jgi:hypothetical protein